MARYNLWQRPNGGTTTQDRPPPEERPDEVWKPSNERPGFIIHDRRCGLRPPLPSDEDDAHITITRDAVTGMRRADWPFAGGQISALGVDDTAALQHLIEVLAERTAAANALSGCSVCRALEGA